MAELVLEIPKVLTAALVPTPGPELIAVLIVPIARPFAALYFLERGRHR